MNDDDFFRPMKIREALALAIILSVSAMISALAAFGVYKVIYPC